MGPLSDRFLAWTLADCLDIALAKGCVLPPGLALGRLLDPRGLAGYLHIPHGRYLFQQDWR